jgi:predicted DNA-binding protein (UPF0251 family)
MDPNSVDGQQAVEAAHDERDPTPGVRDWSLTWPELRPVAAAACTPPELEALRLRAQGKDAARIAAALGISPSGARSRIRRGERKIAQALMLR